MTLFHNNCTLTLSGESLLFILNSLMTINKQELYVILLLVFLWNADYFRMRHDLKVLGTCRFSQNKTMFIWTVSDCATGRQTGKANKTGGKGRRSLNRLFTHRETNRKLEGWRQRSLAGEQMCLCGIIHLAAAGRAGLEPGDWQQAGTQWAREEGHIFTWSGRNKADDYDTMMKIIMMMMMLSPWLPYFKGHPLFCRWNTIQQERTASIVRTKTSCTRMKNEWQMRQ